MFIKQSSAVCIVGVVLLAAFTVLGSRIPAESAVNQTVDGTVDVTRTLKEKPKTWEEVIQPQLKRKEEQKQEEARVAEEKRLAEEAAAAQVQTQVYTQPVVQTSYANGYSYGQCTYYVATRRSIPGNWGNAANWIYGAQASGFPTGQVPQPGAIGVEKGINHVVYVEAVTGSAVVVSEMNYAGWNVVSQRVAPASAFQYIY